MLRQTSPNKMFNGDGSPSKTPQPVNLAMASKSWPTVVQPRTLLLVLMAAALILVASTWSGGSNEVVSSNIYHRKFSTTPVNIIKTETTVLIGEKAHPYPRPTILDKSTPTVKDKEQLAPKEEVVLDEDYANESEEERLPVKPLVAEKSKPIKTAAMVQDEEDDYSEDYDYDYGAKKGGKDDGDYAVGAGGANKKEEKEERSSVKKTVMEDKEDEDYTDYDEDDDIEEESAVGGGKKGDEEDYGAPVDADYQEEEDVEEEDYEDYDDRAKANTDVDYIDEEEEEGSGDDYDYDYEEEEIKPVAVSKTTKVRRNVSGRFPEEMPFLEALATCTTFECVRDAHLQPKEPTVKYNFPHFIIIGFQKTATTSLFHLLEDRKEILRPLEKEPEILTYECDYSLKKCPKDTQQFYIKDTLQLDKYLDSKGQVAAFEASTHIVRGNTNLPRFAQEVQQHFPWVKLVVSLREPISRAISMLVHLKDKHDEGCLAKNPLAFCLLHQSQITFDQKRPVNYSYPLEVWLETFPRNQIHILQYEDLTDAEYEAENLRAVQEFVDVTPGKDDELPLYNSRKFRIKPEGWPMKKADYVKLVNKVRPDAERVAGLAKRYKFGDGQRWLRNWEKVWSENLNSCDANGDCKIQLS